MNSPEPTCACGWCGTEEMVPTCLSSIWLRISLVAHPPTCHLFGCAVGRGSRTSSARFERVRSTSGWDSPRSLTCDSTTSVHSRVAAACGTPTRFAAALKRWSTLSTPPACHLFGWDRAGQNAQEGELRPRVMPGSKILDCPFVCVCKGDGGGSVQTVLCVSAHRGSNKT